MKQKTKKALAKRFKITKGGLILKRHQYSRHLRRKKTKKQIRQFRRENPVDPTFAKKIRKLIKS